MNVEKSNEPERTARRFWLSDNRLSIFADHNDTEGRYDLIEGLLPAGSETALHRHTRYSEHFYQLLAQLPENPPVRVHAGAPRLQRPGYRDWHPGKVCWHDPVCEWYVKSICETTDTLPVLV